jgi:rare lipoprotein A
MERPVSQVLAMEAPRSSDFLRPAIPVLAAGLVATTLLAGLQSVVPVTQTPVSVQPAPQMVNVAIKGSRLETNPVVVAATDPEPAVIGESAAEAKPPAVGGKPMYGVASYYWQGSRTANGERFNPQDLTAAHRTLPFGTRVRVTSLATGRSVTVRINDRGPFVGGRTVDISRAAAQSIGMIDRGVTKVKMDVLE